MENAITYTQKNGIIEIKSYQIGDEVATCISDNGPGIPPEMSDKIFKRYAMAQLIEKKIGSGIGLYLSKQIIEAHNGKIWFESKLQKGSTFCISLPILIQNPLI